MEKAKSSLGAKFRSLWSSLSNKEFRDEFVAANISDTLSLQIRLTRESLGLTQSQLAERSGMKQPSISKLEASCDSISFATAKRIASALDVAVDVKLVSFSALAAEATGNKIIGAVTPFKCDMPDSHMNEVTSAATYSEIIPVITVLDKSKYDVENSIFISNSSRTSTVSHKLPHFAEVN